MNNWNVSGITDFSGVFSGVAGFNETISKWDVSSGTNFVRNEKGVQCDLI
jgi:hypothetical protein